MDKIAYVQTIIEPQHESEKNMEKKDLTVFFVFFSWLTSFFIMEPLTSLLLLDDDTNPTLLTLFTDFTYASIPFLKSIYVYKHIFKMKTFFPSSLSDLPLFISIYVTLQTVLDIIYLVSTQKLNLQYPLQDIFQRYSSITKVSHSVSTSIYGIIWISLTFLVYTKFRPLDCIAAMIASLFLMLLLSYPDNSVVNV